MTKEQFDSLYYGKAVHCDTEEKAKEFLALADSVGYKWITKNDLIKFSEWEKYKKETCYEPTENGFMFADFDFFKHENYEFVEYQLETKAKVETTETLIDEIKAKWSEINILLNRLEKKEKGE